MPRTYETADSTTDAQVYQVMRTLHPGLHDAGVELTILFARAARDADGNMTGPAITVGGYPAYALIKVCSLKDRVGGLKDAVLLLDGDQWVDVYEEMANAIIDRELTRLEVKLDKTGKTKLDDVGRPVLGLRKYDILISGFRECADRHKGDSLEVQAIAKIGGDAVRAGWLPGF